MTAVNGSSQYASANAFRRALEDRLKAEAKARGQPLEALRREFLFQRFLALLFADNNDVGSQGWRQPAHAAGSGPLVQGS